MKKIFLLIFLMLTSPFVFSQDKASQEAKEVMNQFLNMMFNNTLTSEHIDNYVAPRTFKPALSLMSLEDYFNITPETNDPEEIAELVFLEKEIFKFILEKSSFKIEEVRKVHNYEYSVKVSFKLLLSQSFSNRMTDYLDDYLEKEATLSKIQSLTSMEEASNFFLQLVREGTKEFQKLPLKDSDFKKESYTFKVIRVSEKDKLRITFASEEDLYNFYGIFSY